MIFLNQTLLLFWEYNYAVSLSLHIRTLPLVARGESLAHSLPLHLGFSLRRRLNIRSAHSARTADATLALSLHFDIGLPFAPLARLTPRSLNKDGNKKWNKKEKRRKKREQGRG